VCCAGVVAQSVEVSMHVCRAGLHAGKLGCLDMDRIVVIGHHAFMHV
jgi:hypothetical protein